MGEPNIVLARIDNRLIHGQVATQWTGSVGANLILVANDEVASNTMRQHLMDMAAPQGVATETPEDALKLVEGGVPIKVLNIGNMHMSEGKRQVATSVAVDDADVAAFKKLVDLGVELSIQRVPTTAVEDSSKLFN